MVCIDHLQNSWYFGQAPLVFLTHWGRVTHICVSNLTIIGPDNGLSPGRRQAIIWTNAGILLIGPWGTNFSEILIGIYTFLFKKIHLEMSSAKWRPFCLGLNVLWRNISASGYRLVINSFPLIKSFKHMMTSSNGNIFHVTGPLCGEFTGDRLNSPQKGQWRGALIFSLICICKR